MNFEKNSFKISLVQFEPKTNPKDNLEVAKKSVEYAKDKGAHLIAFPEMFMAYPSFSDSIKEIAQTLNGEFVSSVLDLSVKNNIYIAATFWEKSPFKDKVFNTAFLCSPEGKIVTFYRKLHLFDAFDLKESRWMASGDEIPEVVKINGFNVSLTLCYDLRFPELYRILALRGAHLIFVLASWYKGILKEDHWITLLKARALENTVYVAGVGSVGKRFSGRSCVIDPFGVVLVDGGEEENVLFCDLSLSRINRVREKLPTLRHFRKDLFSLT